MSMIQARNDRSDRCNVGDPVKRKQGRITGYVSVAVSIVLFVLISDRLGIFVRTDKRTYSIRSS